MPKIVELIDRRPTIEEGKIGGHEFLNWTNGAIRVRAFDNDLHGSLVELRYDKDDVRKPKEQPNDYGNFRRNIFAIPINRWIPGKQPEYLIPFALKGPANPDTVYTAPHSGSGITSGDIRVFPWKITHDIVPQDKNNIAWKIKKCSGFDRQDNEFSADWVLAIPNEHDQLCLSCNEINNAWSGKFKAGLMQKRKLYLEVNSYWEPGYKDRDKSYYWTPNFWPTLGEQLKGHDIAIPHVFVGSVWPGNDILPTPIAYDIFSSTVYSYRKCDVGEPSIRWADDELGGMTISEAVKHIRGKLS